MIHSTRTLLIGLILSLLIPALALAAPTKTEVLRQDGKWAMVRDGKPYFIKGVGGSGSMSLLAELGGNSVRTWALIISMQRSTKRKSSEFPSPSDSGSGRSGWDLSMTIRSKLPINSRRQADDFEIQGSSGGADVGSRQRDGRV